MNFLRKNKDVMKKIVVTPAGRRATLEILLNHLRKAWLNKEFDEWHLWLNTVNDEDVDYIRKIADQESKWIKLVLLENDEPFQGTFSIHYFFRHYAKPGEVYIRLDDDIVFIEPGAITALFKFRLQNREPFLVYANIVNNAICSHLHQRLGALAPGLPFLKYECMDTNGWNNGEVAESIHSYLISDIYSHNLDKWKFGKWILSQFERCSINVISWTGDRFHEFEGKVGRDEEQWLSVERPMAEGKPNVIFGEKIFAHYSFYTQKEYLDTTNILSSYRELAK